METGVSGIKQRSVLAEQDDKSPPLAQPRLAWGLPLAALARELGHQGLPIVSDSEVVVVRKLHEEGFAHRQLDGVMLI